jgi:hypothetical protein
LVEVRSGGRGEVGIGNVAIGMSAGADVGGIARRPSATATVASRIGSSQPWWSLGSPAVITPRP